jgi:putative hydrolase
MAGFGFTPDDSEPTPENFEAMMRQMQEQFKAQMDAMGISSDAFTSMLPGLLGGLTGGVMGGGAAKEALPAQQVRDVARKSVTSLGSQPIGTNDVTAITNACEIADIWLNEATVFPATQSTTLSPAISRLDWIDTTLPGWQETMQPLAQGLQDAVGRLLDEAMAQENTEAPIGAIASVIKSVIGGMIATQLGQAIAAISASSTGAHEVGLPLLSPARPLLIPENIDAWGADSEIPKTEVYLFHALRESAIARLFEHNPWIVSYIRSAITEYGRGIRIDLDAITRQAEEAMENLQSAHEASFTIALDKGIFTPDETPMQKDALTKLETVLALVDGWADDVAVVAAGDRLPSLDALRELHRRHRAEKSPATQLFKTLLGLEVSPRLSREASAFWSAVRLRGSGIDTRDRIWSGILPTASELLAPDLFIASTEIPDDPSSLF